MQDNPEQASDAATAFEDLRGEVSVLRRAVEALPGEWEARQPPDYTETLGHITQGLSQVAGRLQAVEQHPALKLTPAQHQAVLVSAGQDLMGGAAGRLELAAQALNRERQNLSDVIGTVRGQRRQRNRLAIAAAAALVVGLLLSPRAARLLPFGWDADVAGIILNADHRQAGLELMKSADTERWATLTAMFDLIDSNQVTLSRCREAAQRTRKEQHCVIVVPVPKLTRTP